MTEQTPLPPRHRSWRRFTTTFTKGMGVGAKEALNESGETSDAKKASKTRLCAPEEEMRAYVTSLTESLDQLWGVISHSNLTQTRVHANGIRHQTFTWCMITRSRAHCCLSSHSLAQVRVLAQSLRENGARADVVVLMRPK